jgi:RNA polymerase sigma-70 factor (ECF subfamily)
LPDYGEGTATEENTALSIFTSKRPKEDAAAAEALWREHGPMLTRVLRSYEADRSLLQDLAHDVFIAILTSVSRIAEAEHPKAYLLRIAHNVATDHIGRESRKPFLDDELDPPDSGRTPAQQVEAQHDQAQLLLAVMSLPLSIRQVMVLLLEGVEQSEIAEVLGISHGNVRVRINRGKQLLQEALTNGET